MFAALLASAVLASASPDARLAWVQSTATFHVYVMPDSSVVRQVNVLAADAVGHPTAVRIVYDLSNQTLVVEEAAYAGDSSSPQTFGPDAIYVNGYPATYTRTGPYYRKEGHLTWWPAGVKVELSSTDLWDVPALVNATLSLR
jgi:hypothetical protein